MGLFSREMLTAVLNDRDNDMVHSRLRGLAEVEVAQGADENPAFMLRFLYWAKALMAPWT